MNGMRSQSKWLHRHAVSLVLGLWFLLSPAAHGLPTTFWVAPDGNDSGPGTEEQPFRTIEHARDAVRAIGRDHEIVVYLREGIYRLDRPLVLDHRDSGRDGCDVVYRAAPDEHPVISGAIKVPKESWQPDPNHPGIWHAHVGPHETRQLYVNGERATRARTELVNGTNYPAGFLPKPVVNPGPPVTIGGGIKFVPTSLNPSWGDPHHWKRVRDIEAVILTQWKMMSVPLDKVSSGRITMQQPAWKNANLCFSSSSSTNSPPKPGVWSFWQVTRFENALEFLDQPGEWYLDREAGWLYYMPRPDEDFAGARVELPVLEVLVEGRGKPGRPVSNIRFEGLTFQCATWLEPNGGRLGGHRSNGYVTDQSGFRLEGEDHQPNLIGHDPKLVRTPGNLRFRYARNITFHGNIFEHLGGVGLDFVTGCKGNRIEGNLFTDISSAAIQLGGVGPEDSHPKSPGQIMRDNVIANNLIREVACEFQDAAGIFVGFSQNTTLEHNTIVDVPWSGIAVGWGWGLLDPGGYPGLPGATNNMWGVHNTPTPNRNNRILHNRIHKFLNVLWDGGSIYTTGAQGTSPSNGLLIEGNVADGKRVKAGGNTFYTDGGSRYITLKNNASCNNPIGVTDYGPPPQWFDPLPYLYIPPVPYGSDSGGCRTYGQIRFEGNYWRQFPMTLDQLVYDAFYALLPGFGFGPWSEKGYLSIAPYTNMVNHVSYPTQLSYEGNHDIWSVGEVPDQILNEAGVRKCPETIPEDQWILPPSVQELEPIQPASAPPTIVARPYPVRDTSSFPSKQAHPSPPSPNNNSNNTWPRDVDW